ncbi:hypothetical protein [Actinomadura roseirufa]|uniref:hypothetical protein n=1 Tax=Actinomadura roseirufa TaxID=2094049 RepID=UPI0013F1551F|nr:hypothetical protein [Actinomadura roseirufa]
MVGGQPPAADRRHEPAQGVGEAGSGPEGVDGLPLAVCACGARLAARRRWPISRAVAELRDEERRLAALRTREGDMAVDVVFNASYQGLDPDHARAYRLLGTHPGARFDLGAAAALVGADEDRAAELLNGLVDASLLQEGEDEDYRFHDLVRLHARDKATEVDSGAERAAAFRRLADHCLDRAVAADVLVLPGRWHLGDRYPGARPERFFPGRAAALDWLDREGPNLVAVVREAHAAGLSATAWQLCEAMWPLFLHLRPYRTWIEPHELGAAAAEADGAPRARARMLAGVGMAHLKLGDHDAALVPYREALALERREGHRLGEAAALEGLGIAALGAGDAAAATELFTAARDAHAALGRPRGVALMRRHIGGALSVAGRHDEALREVRAALETFTELADDYHMARTFTCLGECHARAGRDAAAAGAFGAALERARVTGARHEEGGLLWKLALLAARSGDPATERRLLRQAHAVYAELDAPRAEAVRHRLDRTTAAGPAQPPDEPPEEPPPGPAGPAPPAPLPPAPRPP